MSKEETSHSLKLLVRTSFFVFFTIVVSKLFSYLYKIVIARNFGPEIYGTFSLAVIIISIFGSLSLFGFPDGITRFVSYYKGKKEQKKIKYIIKLSLILLPITSIIMAIILFFSAESISIRLFHNTELIIYLKILSASLPFTVLFTIFTSYLRAIGKVNLSISINNIIQSGLKIGILSILVLFGMGHNSTVLSFTLSFLFLALISYILSYKSISLLFKNKDLEEKERKTARSEIFSYSLPLILLGTLYNILYWTDSLVLGYFNDAKVVGFYNAAITLIFFFAIAQDLFSQLFFPMLSEKYAQNKKKIIRDVSKQVMKWVYLINIIVFAALAIFPGVAINFFFGADYLSAQMPLRILAFGALLSGFLGLFMTLLSIKGETKTILKDYIIFAIVNFVLDLVLVKFYGMNGAALATSITWIAFTLLVMIQIKKAYGFFPIKRDLIKITFVAGVIIIIAYLVHDLFPHSIINMAIFGILFLLIYVGALIAAKCFDEHDKEVFHSIWSKVLSYKK